MTTARLLAGALTGCAIALLGCAGSAPAPIAPSCPPPSPVAACRPVPVGDAVTVTGDVTGPPVDGPAPSLVLARAPQVGVPIDARVDLGGLRSQPMASLERVVLVPARGLATGAARFESDEPTVPGNRYLGVVAPAFELIALAPGEHRLVAVVTNRAGGQWRVSWPITAGAPAADECPAATPSSVDVTVDGPDAPFPTKARVWFPTPPRVGVATTMRLEVLAAPELLALDDPQSFNPHTDLAPAAAPDLGLAASTRKRAPHTIPRYLEQTRIEFELPIQPTRAGELPATATLIPRYCGAQSCHQGAKVTLRWTVPVAP